MMKKQSGFTLIEIVMVLVLLGILTAVAVPKYFDLQEEAARNVANSYAAEYQSRLNAEFAKELMKGETCSQARSNAVTTVNGDSTIVGASIENGIRSGVSDATSSGKKPITIAVKGKVQTDATYEVTLPACSSDNTNTTTTPDSEENGEKSPS